MTKIPKNRPDTEMITNWKEQLSFENLSDGEAAPPIAKAAKKDPVNSSYANFFTPELQEAIGKALLTLKLNLYKEGIIDYTIKVLPEASQIVLKAVPTNKKSNHS